MISPVPGGARRRSRVARIGLLAVAGLLAAAAQEATATAAPTTSSFTTVSAPFTSARDYITGIQSCALPGSAKTIGPIGVLLTKTQFLVTDICNYTTYSYTPGATSGTNPRAVQNGLSAGLALDNGVYYGVASASHIVANGIYAFDPGTLALGIMVAPIPCNGDARDLATDPASGDLFLTTKCGLWRIPDPKSATDKKPVTPVLIGKGSPNVDGIEVVNGGKDVWVATVDTGVDEYDTSNGHVVASVPMSADPDGLALAGANAASGIAGNLFVNSNDGTITMIDLKDEKTSIVASGGTRGDFVTVGDDGMLYATQSDRIEQLGPGIFVPNPVTGSPPPSSPSSSPTKSPSSSKPTTTRTTTGPTGTPTTTIAPTEAATGPSLPGTGAGLALPLLLTGISIALLGALIVLWTRRQRAQTGSHE